MADMQGRLPDGYSASCRRELDDARTGSLVRTPYILCANTGMDGFCIAVAVNFACNTSKQDRQACLWGKTVSSTWSGLHVLYCVSSNFLIVNNNIRNSYWFFLVLVFIFPNRS